MPSQTENIENQETRIYVALGELLRHFNFLDLNLGLCLRHLENPDDPSKSNSRLRGMNTKKKLEQIHQLITTQENLKGISTDEEFMEWLQSADKCRAIRNFYIHGTWEYLPMDKKTPLRFQIPKWMKLDSKEGGEKLMTIKELESSVKEVEMVFNEFCRLRRKHGI